MRALEGVRVLELGNFIAAPTAGKLLAEFGAEVIKIEQPGKGDPIRQWRLERGSTSMLWRTLGRNKKSVTIDLSVPAGADLVRRLAGHVDAVLENYRPGKLESWGIGPDELRKHNKNLVVVRISGHGQTGPYRHRLGFGGVAESMGGLRYLTGYADRPPTRVGVSIGDSIAGLYAAFGVLVGLREVDKGIASGETVDVALTEAVLSMMESLIPDQSAYGTVRQRLGNATRGVAPTGTYPCLDDDWVVIGGNSDGIYRRLMTAIGRPDLAADPGLQSNPERWKQEKLLNGLIADWTAERTLKEVVKILSAADIPVGPIYSSADIVEDEQYRARGMLVEHYVRVDGPPEPVLFPGVVPVLEQAPGYIRWLGPELGEHTSEVLTDLLELHPTEISELRQQGVI